MANDRNKLLDRLHNALRDERLAAYCYRIQSEEAEACAQTKLAERLFSIAKDHERHVEIVERRIIDLGGSPRPFHPPPEVLERMRCLPRQDFCSALEFDLKAEDTEIETYETIAGQSDSNTADICRTLTEEDRRHARWLRNQLVTGRQLDEEMAERE